MYQRKVFERYFSEQEERQLMQCVRGANGVLARRDESWITLLRQTGIRVGALAQLTLEDAIVAVRTGELTLRREIQKRARGHSVTLNQKARRALIDLVRIRESLGANEDPAGPLLLSREFRGRARRAVNNEQEAILVAYGAGMSVRTLQQRMTMWCKRAGLPDGSPHWMRHTLAKRLMARSTARNPLSIVAGVLGHSSLNSTAVYTQPDKEEIARAMEAAA